MIADEEKSVLPQAAQTQRSDSQVNSVVLSLQRTRTEVALDCVYPFLLTRNL